MSEKIFAEVQIKVFKKDCPEWGRTEVTHVFPQSDKEDPIETVTRTAVRAIAATLYHGNEFPYQVVRTLIDELGEVFDSETCPEIAGLEAYNALCIELTDTPPIKQLTEYIREFRPAEATQEKGD